MIPIEQKIAREIARNEVTKHLRGKHDQKEHGSKGRERFSAISTRGIQIGAGAITAVPLLDALADVAQSSDKQSLARAARMGKWGLVALGASAILTSAFSAVTKEKRQEIAQKLEGKNFQETERNVTKYLQNQMTKRGSHIEQLIEVDKNGKIVGYELGDEGSVGGSLKNALSVLVPFKFKRNDNIVYHNHPGLDLTLSIPDVTFTAGTGKKGIYAVTSKGNVGGIEFKPKDQRSSKQVREAAKATTREWVNETLDKFGARDFAMASQFDNDVREKYVAAAARASDGKHVKFKSGGDTVVSAFKGNKELWDEYNMGTGGSLARVHSNLAKAKELRKNKTLTKRHGNKFQVYQYGDKDTYVFTPGSDKVFWYRGNNFKSEPYKTFDNRKKFGTHLAFRDLRTLGLKRPKTPMSDRLAKSGEKEFLCEFSKFDKDRQQVFGWASIVEENGRPVVDKQLDVIAKQDLEDAAYTYVLKSRDGGEMHKRRGVATMIESMVFTPEKISKMGLPPNSLPTGWWVGFQIHDNDVWDKVKKGDYSGFSIHGAGKRSKTDFDELVYMTKQR